MRVLRVLTRPNGGGPVRHLGALERELRGLGVESRFLVGACRRGEEDCEALLRAAGARPTRLAALRPSAWPSDVIAAAREISRHVSEYQPDLIHSHTAVAGAAARLAAPPATPVCHTFHGHTLSGGYRGRLGNWMVRQVERRLARRTDVLIAVAERVRDDLITAGLRPKRGWAVLPPAPDPLPPLPSRRAARAGLQLTDATPILLFAGRLERVKGLDVLLGALRDAPESGALAHAVLLVCGAGREENALRRAARRLGERVRFLGWRRDLSAPLAAADLGVLPSRNEGWPLFLADAAAARLPVVATDVGGCAEALARLGNGVLVPPGDPRALAAALEGLLVDPQRRAALASASAGDGWWSPTAAAAAHQRLYEALTAGGEDGPWAAAP